MCPSIVIILSHSIYHQIVEYSDFTLTIIYSLSGWKTPFPYSNRQLLRDSFPGSEKVFIRYALFSAAYRHCYLCKNFSSKWDLEIWKYPLDVVGAETSYNSLIYVHWVSFRNEVTNLSYRLSFGVNFGIHRRNLLTTMQPLSAPWALWISSSSLFNSILNCSCMGTNILSSSSSKNDYLFNGIITLTSFAPPPPLS